jgi:hypothetical protein
MGVIMPNYHFGYTTTNEDHKAECVLCKNKIKDEEAQHNSDSERGIHPISENRTFICRSCKKKLSIKKYKKSDIMLYKSDEDITFLRNAIKIEDLLT